MNPLITVIIPVYNQAQYLDRCVRSVLSQTYWNLEIILIDDGSTDYCAEMCDRYALQDQRIRVIHQANKGLSCARNAAIEASSGDYIAFADSDDAVDPDLIRKAYDALVSTQSDMCIFEYRIIGENGEEEPKDYRPVSGVFTARECVELLMKDHEITNHVWRRLVRSDIVRKHPFPEGKLYEDAYVVPCWTYECRRICCIPDALYDYCRHKGTITDDRSVGNIHAQLDAYRFKLNTIISYWPDLEENAYGWYIKSCLNSFRENAYPERRRKPEEYRHLKKEMTALVRSTDAWRILPSGYRMKASVLRWFPALTEIVFGIYDTVHPRRK